MSDLDPTTHVGRRPDGSAPRPTAGPPPARGADGGRVPAKKAYLVRPLPLDPTLLAIVPHTASLYRMDPPMRFTWACYDHAIVLAQHDHIGPHTLVLGADADANILSLGDLPGSYDGGMDHVEALRRAGYEVVLEDGPHATVGEGSRS